MAWRKRRERAPCHAIFMGIAMFEANIQYRRPSMSINLLLAISPLSSFVMKPLQSSRRGYPTITTSSNTADAIKHLLCHLFRWLFYPRFYYMCRVGHSEWKLIAVPGKHYSGVQTLDVRGVRLLLRLIENYFQPHYDSRCHLDLIWSFSKYLCKHL